MNISTPNGSFLSASNPNAPILERSLIVNQNRRKFRNNFVWGAVNLALLAVLLYDVSDSCSWYLSYFQYFEYTLIVLLTVNVFFHLFKILKSMITKQQVTIINKEQAKLLGIKETDPNYKIMDQKQINLLNQTPKTSLCTPVSTPMNLTALSWRSNLSPSDSLNYSLSSPSWVYHKGSADVSLNQYSNKASPITTPVKPSMYRDTSSVDYIGDETSLNKYLKEHEQIEKVNKMTNKSQHSSNLLNSFWSHPVTKTAKDMSTFLKNCQYQLSSQSPVKTSSSAGKEDTSTPAQTSALEVWTRINVDTVALTQWNENLRMWISQTILDRLVNEFDRINDSLEKHGLTDIKIGGVGLDRLRKTAQLAQVTQFIPSLATLIQFLEVSTNQEYLVKRIRELAKGGCMSEFKWNGGSSYNGKSWEDSLPTDCAIVMHLVACYLDTQLMPLPNMPDTKAFSGYHYIKTSDKMPNLTPKSLFIQEVSEKPPHYRVVVGEKVFEMVKGYNNLFHSILFFIYHVNKLELGMLGRINLGRAGLNILWIIDQ